MKPARLALVLVALALSACDDPTRAPAGDGSSVEVVPGSGDLLVGDTLSLRALPRDGSGQVLVGVHVAWNVDAAARMTLVPQGSVARTTALRAGPVTVTATAGGRSGRAELTVLNPAPVVGALAPASAPGGTAGVTLVVRGTGFTPDSRVEWNGNQRPTTFVDATELRATVGAGDLATPGVAQVRVVTPPPGGGAAPALTFTVDPPGPPPVASVELDVDSVALLEGGIRQLAATVRDAQGTVITGLGMQWPRAAWTTSPRGRPTAPRSPSSGPGPPSSATSGWWTRAAATNGRARATVPDRGAPR